MTTLVQMGQAAYTSFFELAVSSYAAENVASGRWPAADAAHLSRSETERLLPQGVQTPDHYLYEIRDESINQTVGFVWFAAMMRGSVKIAYLYQIQVMPEFQRKGHARAALVTVERIASALGMSRIGLHVFGHNSAAQTLYRSLGYGVTSLNLEKVLPANGA
jgi:ribosomal protein S18 acetylase RimI-like enzyme